MRNKRKGFSLIELLIVVAIILILAAIAIPNLLRSKIAANQASAVASLRSLNTSSMLFNTSYSQFPSALSNFATPSSGTVSSTAADLIDSVLATGTKSGYSFSWSGGGTTGQYAITAVPVSTSSGTVYYYTDQSLVIRSNPGAAATSGSLPIGN